MCSVEEICRPSCALPSIDMLNELNESLLRTYLANTLKRDILRTVDVETSDSESLDDSYAFLSQTADQSFTAFVKSDGTMVPVDSALWMFMFDMARRFGNLGSRQSGPFLSALEISESIGVVDPFTGVSLFCSGSAFPSASHFDQISRCFQIASHSLPLSDNLTAFLTLSTASFEQPVSRTIRVRPSFVSLIDIPGLQRRFHLESVVIQSDPIGGFAVVILSGGSACILAANQFLQKLQRRDFTMTRYRGSYVMESMTSLCILPLCKIFAKIHNVFFCRLYRTPL